MKNKFKKPKDFLVAIAGVIGILYIINPTAGILELIPDIIPFIGNLDEAAAMFLIYSTAEYFDYDIKSLFKRK